MSENLPSSPRHSNRLPKWLIQDSSLDSCQRIAQDILSKLEYWKKTLKSENSEHILTDYILSYPYDRDGLGNIKNRYPEIEEFLELIKPYQRAVADLRHYPEHERSDRLALRIRQIKIAQDLPKPLSFEREVEGELRRRVGRIKASSRVEGIDFSEAKDAWVTVAELFARNVESGLFILPYTHQGNPGLDYNFYTNTDYSKDKNSQTKICGFDFSLGFVRRETFSEELPVSNGPFQIFNPGMFLDSEVLELLCRYPEGISLLKDIRKIGITAAHDWGHHYPYGLFPYTNHYLTLSHHNAPIYSRDDTFNLNKVFDHLEFPDATLTAYEALSYVTNKDAVRYSFEKNPQAKRNFIKRVEDFCDKLARFGKFVEHEKGEEYAERVKAYLGIVTMERVFVVLDSKDPQLELVQKKIESLNLNQPSQTSLEQFITNIVSKPILNPTPKSQTRISQDEKHRKVMEAVMDPYADTFPSFVPQDYLPGLKIVKHYFNNTPYGITPYDEFLTRCTMESWANRFLPVHDKEIAYPASNGLRKNFIEEIKKFRDPLQPQSEAFAKRIKALQNQRQNGNSKSS